MKRPSKAAFLVLTGFAAIAVLLWMRSLASWRPQKLAILSHYYRPQYISSDGRFIVSYDAGALEEDTFNTFELTTGKSYSLGQFQKARNLYRPAFGWREPFYWHLAVSTTGAPLSIELQDPSHQRPKHSFPWANRDCTEFMAVEADEKTASVLTSRFFREFDLTTDQMTREVRLEKPFTPKNKHCPRYAIASDRKTLYACLDRQGKVWDARTGKMRAQWTVDVSKSIPPDPDPFSPDARTIVFRRNLSWFITDSTTGKIRWQVDTSINLRQCFSPEADEIILPQRTGCEVRDVMTGRVLRQLPAPTWANSDVIRVTHDTIYTQNLQGAILRWRAR